MILENSTLKLLDAIIVNDDEHYYLLRFTVCTREERQQGNNGYDYGTDSCISQVEFGIELVVIVRSNLFPDENTVFLFFRNLFYLLLYF